MTIKCQTEPGSDVIYFYNITTKCQNKFLLYIGNCNTTIKSQTVQAKEASFLNNMTT